MDRYGSDKPDLRIPMELVSVDEHVAHVEFNVFSGPANDDGSRVAALERTRWCRAFAQTDR